MTQQEIERLVAHYGPRIARDILEIATKEPEHVIPEDNHVCRND